MPTKVKLNTGEVFIISSKGVNLKTFEQRGSTCGIYALHAILKQYEKAGGLNKRLPAPTKDHKNPHMGLRSNYSLRQEAKELGLTKIGELFNTEHMVKLAQNYGVNAKEERVNQVIFFDKIKKAIDKDRLILVPFCVKSRSDGNPAAHGINPHVCVVFGYRCGISLQDHKVLATHWDQLFIFKSKDLQASNASFKPFLKQKWGKPLTRYKYGDINTYEKVGKFNMFKYKLNRKPFSFGRTIPYADLQTTLANKIVIV